MPSLIGVALSPGEFPPIDDLPNASTPLSGSEFAPISQSGVDSKVTVANLTAGRAVSVATLVSRAGTALLPAVTTTGNLNTGVWFPAADTVAVSTGGGERVRVSSAGQFLVGSTAAMAIEVAGASGAGATTAIQAESLVTSAYAGATFVLHTTTTVLGPTINLARTRGSALGAVTIVQSGDGLGGLRWSGADGTDIRSGAAEIFAAVDGTPGLNDMPGRLVFGTTADGEATPTERMRINSSGNIGIGTTSPGALLDVRGNSFFNNPNSGYATTATAAGTTTLTSSSLRQQYFTGSSTQTVVLPVTSTLALGWRFEIYNNSTGLVTLQSSGANTIRVLEPGSSVVATCILTSGTGVASWSAGHASSAGGALYTNNQTGTTYSFALTDGGATVTASNASASTYTLPQTSSVAFPIGTRIKLVNLGVGAVTLVKEGSETLDGNTLVNQYAVAFIEKLSSTKWEVFGGTAIIPEVINGNAVGVIVNQTYDISVKMNFSGTITSITTKSTTTTVAGTFTVAISGVSVTGLTTVANGATGVRTTTSPSGANTFVTGDYITITFAGATITDMFWSLAYTRVY